MTKNEYSNIQDDYFCSKCIGKIVPFSKLTDNEFYLSVVNCSKTPLNYVTDFNLLPPPAQQRLFNKLNDIINQSNIDQNNDEDDEQHLVDCNYYSVNFLMQSLMPQNPFLYFI